MNQPPPAVRRASFYPVPNAPWWLGSELATVEANLTGCSLAGGGPVRAGAVFRVERHGVTERWALVTHSTSARDVEWYLALLA